MLAESDTFWEYSGIVPIPSRPVLDEEGEDTSVSLEQRIDSNIAQTRVGDRAGCETNVQERLLGARFA